MNETKETEMEKAATNIRDIYRQPVELHTRSTG
jgi:hypothetical protein